MYCLLYISACVFCASYIKMKRSEKRKIFPDGLLIFAYCLLFICNTNYAYFFLSYFTILCGLRYWCFCVKIMLEMSRKENVELGNIWTKTKKWDCWPHSLKWPGMRHSVKGLFDWHPVPFSLLWYLRLIEILGKKEYSALQILKMSFYPENTESILWVAPVSPAHETVILRVPIAQISLYYNTICCPLDAFALWHHSKNYKHSSLSFILTTRPLSELGDKHEVQRQMSCSVSGWHNKLHIS